MKLMYTKDGKSGRKRAPTGNGNRASKGGGDDRAKLRAHGYEAKPEVWMPVVANENHFSRSQ